MKKNSKLLLSNLTVLGLMTLSQSSTAHGVSKQNAKIVSKDHQETIILGTSCPDCCSAFSRKVLNNESKNI